MRTRVCLMSLVSFVCLVFVCASLLALAACGGAPTTHTSSTTTSTSSTATPTMQTSPTATTAAGVTPTNTSSSGLTIYTSPDNTYKISYPTGWQVQTASGEPGGVGFSGTSGQFFEVKETAATSGFDPAQYVTDYCQSINVGQNIGQTTGSPVVLGGQTWFKAECGADAQPTTVVIVEVVTYKGALYQIDYSSSAAAFQADFNTYYGPMEQSFQFLS